MPLLRTAQTVPMANDAASGAGSLPATITFKGTSGTLAWHVVFEHLSGPASAAHVHLGPPGAAGPVAIPLCAPCKPNSHGSFTGPIGGQRPPPARAPRRCSVRQRAHELNPQGE